MQENKMYNSLVEEYYNTNEQVRSYVDAYAIQQNILVEEAFEHLLVKEYVRWIMQTLSD